MKHGLLVVLLAILLMGCSTKTEPPIEIIKYQTRTVEKPKKILPLPDQLKMREVRWKVINQDGTAYFGLDSKNYENLSLNLNDLRTYVDQSNIIIRRHNESDK